MNRKPSGLSTLLLSACLCSAASGEDWPQFRGPSASGIGTGRTPITWNVETGENVRWKVEVSGLGHGSPIVWGDRIMLATAVPETGKDAGFETGWLNGTGDSADDAYPWTWKVVCFSRKDGRILWDTAVHSGVPRQKRHLKATHANTTPATDGRYVVACFGSEGLYCLDMDGKLLWKADLGLLEVGPARTDMEWGYASSPIIYDGNVIVQCDARNTGFWASFDLKSGKEIQRVKRSDDSTWSTPNVLDANGTTQLICNGYKELAGYDLATGERLWSISTAGGDIPVPTPLLSDGLVYVTNGHGRTASFAIEPGARGDLTPRDDDLPKGLAWYKLGKGSYMPTPIIYEGKLYIGDDNGRLRCLDVRTGDQHYATRLSSSGTTFSASPVAANGHIYFTSEDGEIFVVKAGETFEPAGTNSMNETCMATPAISDGDMFIRTKGHLYALASVAK